MFECFLNLSCLNQKNIEKPCVIRPAETPPAVEPPRSPQQLKRRGKASGDLKAELFLLTPWVCIWNGTPTKKHDNAQRLCQNMSRNQAVLEHSWMFFLNCIIMGETWWNWGWLLSVIFFSKAKTSPDNWWATGQFIWILAPKIYSK